MGAFIRRYLALATKEVQQLRRNKGLLVQLMIPPTLVLILFGYALNPKVRGLRMGVVDESHTAQSRDFVNALTENVNFDVTRRFIRTQDAEDALDQTDILYQFDSEYIRRAAARFNGSLRLHLRMRWAGEDHGQGRAQRVHRRALTVAATGLRKNLAGEGRLSRCAHAASIQLIGAGGRYPRALCGRSVL